MVDISRRSLMASSVAAALGASVVGSGVVSADVDESDTPGAPSVKGSLKRFSNTAFGAEVTGPYVFADGTPLYSLQHPNTDNTEPFNKAGVGYVSGFSFEMAGSNDDFEELSAPNSEKKRRKVRTAAGDYTMLFSQEESIGDGDEQLGVPQTPDGENIDKYPGTRYSEAGYTPDCNQFIPSNDEGTEGHLFTNFEATPGNVTRVPVSKTDDGEWTADTQNAINMANTEALRSLGGTMINCYGDRSPWDTMVSAEENYAHPRVNFTHTVGDIVEAESGKGLIGGCQFWNRPSPTAIQSAVNDYYDDEAWTLQGYWALAGVELLAYSLGAAPTDTTGVDTETSDTYGGSEVADGAENNVEPITDEEYPNPYRYGYFVDYRDPHAETPDPIKYYVIGRAAWECPDFQNDLKTVYGCSDGDSKGIYKFVADEEIPSYADPMDVEGTLYAPKITNDAASAADSGTRASPADVDLEVEWIPIGHASNAEIESWIAEYDDVTQEDYLTTHTDYDEAELGQDVAYSDAIEEADREVIANGNQNYITNEEIVEWARQYEERGYDGVDEDLRRVPFLELRAAAKEIGASIEFNKAEGVDSADDAGPGDYVYFGISEFNDDMADDTGDLQMDRVDGGVVYRGELDTHYDISRLEPVIVGPDFTDGPQAANDALRNVDNVNVMDDGRVLCCEDGFNESKRSYPNDCLWVYQPNPTVAAGSAAVAQGDSVTVDVRAKHIPDGIAGGTFSVSVADPDVAQITSASYPDAAGLTKAPQVADDGSTAAFEFADVQEAMQADGVEFTLATLTLSGVRGGATGLDVQAALDDDAGNDIAVETRSGIALTGPASVAPSGAPPSDPDGDGLFEDVNGNGRVDYDDVVLFFQRMDSKSISSNTRSFDFNGNERLDYADIVQLYQETGAGA
ncbi:alkaline phosphatase PhoX [Halarchaeum nitratireducens]|uniref:alkaline phosphatase PhoX n=1 Tax=Halarchaeum nitratireducens TaxID=489913 RepID=UPI001668F9F4|nr:alkaline phosphatase PhoX [Halarchaeum nitratireducens]